MYAVKYADRVAETTTTSGTGTITLAGAKTGYLTFSSAFDTGAKVYYCITDNATNIEVGIGTMVSSTTLSRDLITFSTNANTAISLSGSSMDVYNTLPAYVVQRGSARGRIFALVNGLSLP